MPVGGRLQGQFMTLSQSVFKYSSMKFTTILSLSILGFIILQQVLKLIYLWFSPPFMDKNLFGPPKSKLSISVYYLLTTFLFLVFFLEKLGIIDALND